MNKKLKPLLVSIWLLSSTFIYGVPGFSGAGTLADPYQITTAAELATLATNVNAGTSYEGYYFKLMNDISLSAYPSWTPIGNITISSPAISGTPFSGSFNGNNFTISGLTIAVSAATTRIGFGLFGYVDATGTVSNLNVTGVSRTISIASKKYVGGLIGANQGIVDSCSTSGMLRNANLGKEIEEMIDSEKTRPRIVSKLLSQDSPLNAKSNN